MAGHIYEKGLDPSCKDRAIVTRILPDEKGMSWQFPRLAIWG